jgi:predicted ATPase
VRHASLVGDVTIRLLGGFAAVRDGQPVPREAWRLRKARELVKLLALAPGQRLHREQAMDVLWGERDPAAAANNLNQVVHVARGALGPETIEARDGLLRLEAEVDVDAFERAAADARRVGAPSAYRAALSLYGGELLPENRYDDWAQERRQDIVELHEELKRELAELGLAGAVRGLPLDASSFVGREHELRELRALLSGTRLLTLTGTGGAGKTRLALELARRAEPSYREGAALVELAAVRDGRLVVDAVAAALDVRALPGGGLADAIAELLASRSLLVVLDNCEHVLAACAALVDRLLRAAPRLAIVATSREPLRLAAEIVFRVPSLALPDPDVGLEPAGLLRYEAVQLFIERAAAAAPEFELDAESAADVARICFRLDGLPLALELAAGRLGALGSASLAERLDDRFRLLRAGSRAAPTRQQTLEATLTWSHDLLATDERVLLRRLAVFAGGFGLDAAEQVCTGKGPEVGEVADVLSRLVDKSLVAADRPGRERRYRLLETVRLYAKARLEEAQEAERFASSHAEWALALAERERDSRRLDRETANLRVALHTLLASAPVDALHMCVALWLFWLRRIDLEEGHRRFVEALAATPQRTSLRAEALLAAAALCLRGGRLALGDEHAHESLAIAREHGNAKLQWRALHFLGASAIAGDELHSAIVWFERALGVARREGLAAAEALCVYCTGVAHFSRGDLVRAEELVADSVERFQMLAGGDERIPSPPGVPEIRGPTGAGAGLRTVFGDTLHSFVEVSARQAIGHALANQAVIARERGDLARARRLLEDAGERFRRLGDERGQADVHVRLAYVALAEGSSEDARSCLARALASRRRLRDRRGVGMALSGLGLVDTVAGDYKRAGRELAEARELFRRAADRWGLTGALWNTADLEIARGELEAADAALEEAQAVAAETGRDRWVAQTIARLADTAILRGDLQRAEALLTEAQDLYASTHDEIGAAEVAARLKTLKRSLSERKARAGTTPRTQ